MNVDSDPNAAAAAETGFPHAPEDWRQDDAQKRARDEGIELGPDHWQALRCLQFYFSRHEDTEIRIRALKDALEEHFHHKGGLGYLHRLFPGGPVAQGCRLAGLPVPPGAVDKSFGSVQ